MVDTYVPADGVPRAGAYLLVLLECEPDDPDCAGDPMCCIWTGPEVCNDRIDNDCDRATDCSDYDCRRNPVCTGCTVEVLIPDFKGRDYWQACFQGPGPPARPAGPAAARLP